MVKNKVFIVLLIILITISSFNLNSYAETQVTRLEIVSYNYSTGDSIAFREVNTVEIGKTLQLHAIITESDNIVWRVKETNLSNLTWSSSDTSVATVDNNGKVTGLKEGNATITVNYSLGESDEEKTATKQIEVIKADDTKEKGILIEKFNDGDEIFEKSILVNNSDYFVVKLQNIPANERENVKITIEDTSVAEIEMSGLWENDGSFIAVHIKGLKEGSTKVTASITYNGETYTDSFSFNVIKSLFKIEIVPERNISSLKVNDTLQLNVFFRNSDGTNVTQSLDTIYHDEWSTSNEKVAKVDNTGLVTAVGEGNAVITVKVMSSDSETFTATYDIKVTASEETPGSPTPIPDKPTSSPQKGEKLPQTGLNGISAILLIVSIGIGIFAYIKYRKYKNI